MHNAPFSVILKLLTKLLLMHKYTIILMLQLVNVELIATIFML